MCSTWCTYIVLIQCSLTSPVMVTSRTRVRETTCLLWILLIHTFAAEHPEEIHGDLTKASLHPVRLGLVLTIFNEGLYFSSIVKPLRIRSWNQPLLDIMGNMSCSREQWGPWMGLELRTSSLRVRRATHCTTPPQYLPDVYMYDNVQPGMPRWACHTIKIDLWSTFMKPRLDIITGFVPLSNVGVRRGSKHIHT